MALTSFFRLFLIASLITTAGILIVRVPPLISAENPLPAADQFATPLSDPFLLLDVRPTPTGRLLYLYRGPAGAEIVEQDRNGAVTNTIAFSDEIPSHGLAVSPEGEVAVIQSSHRGGQVLLFDAAGRIKQTIPLTAEQIGSQIFFLGSRVLILRNNTIIDPLTSDFVRPSLPLPAGPLRGYSAGLTTSLILAETADLVAILRPDQQPYAVQLVAPELQANVEQSKAMSRNPTVFEHAMFDASVTDKGAIFLGLTHLQLRAGSLVFRFNALTGELVHSYRLGLLTLDAARKRGNPDGYIRPTWLSVVDGSLFLISRSERMVARYAID